MGGGNSGTVVLESLCILQNLHQKIFDKSLIKRKPSLTLKVGTMEHNLQPNNEKVKSVDKIPSQMEVVPQRNQNL